MSDFVDRGFYGLYFTHSGLYGYLKERKEELNSGLESIPGMAKFAVTTYQYDENGNRTKIITPEGYEILRTYDCRDRLASERCIDTANGIDRTVSVTYDEAGNVTQILRQGRDGEPWEIKYDYDLKNRITHVGDCLGPVFYYEYDQNDRLVKEIRPQAEASRQEYKNVYHYSYNHRGDPVTLQDSKRTMLEHNTYHPDGSLASRTEANGNQVNFTYNLLGRTNEITTTRSQQAGVTAQSYLYDSRGRITGVTNGNQAYTAYDMDSWGHITRSKNPDGGKEGYTYDYAGNITGTTDGNGNTITYRYNSQGKVCEIID